MSGAPRESMVARSLWAFCDSLHARRLADEAPLARCPEDLRDYFSLGGGGEQMGEREREKNSSLIEFSP